MSRDEEPARVSSEVAVKVPSEARGYDLVHMVVLIAAVASETQELANLIYLLVHSDPGEDSRW